MSYKRVLITDLDDTLWDWLDIWYSSFKPMFDEIQKIIPETEQTLISVIKTIHQHHGTSEYFFLVQEIEKAFGRETDFDHINVKFGRAFHAFRSGRKKSLRLFPHVYDTLVRLKDKGVLIIGYTESMAYASIQRLRYTKLDGILDILYSSPDHDMPVNLDLQQVRTYENSQYRLDHTIHRHTKKKQYKPNPSVLRNILKEVLVEPDDCVYVGDNLLKDIKMAQDVGLLDVFAEYGKSIHSKEYDFLKKVTHWSDQMVEEEKKTKKLDVKPSITLERNFSQLLGEVKFSPYLQ